MHSNHREEPGAISNRTIRSVLKWTGLGIAAGLMAVWIGSMQWDCLYGSDNRKPGWRIGIRLGIISLAIQEPHYPMAARAREPSGWRIWKLDWPYNLEPSQRLGLVMPKRRVFGRLENLYTLPLWLPFTIVATPTIALFILDIRRKLKTKRARVRRTYVVRYRMFPSFLLGVGIFIAFIMASPLVCDRIPAAFLPRELGLPYVQILAFLVLLAAYLCARVVYSRARWRLIVTSAEHCQTCGYNLTGNVSGICPECGTPLSTSLDVNH